MNAIDVTITSYPDRPGLVAEFWCEQGMWGELRLDEATGIFSMELFPLEAGHRPMLDLEALEKAIAKAKRRLLEIEGLESSAKP
ncbi:MAG TPA: hypothetical protein VJ783_02340 [Pirellulales bacterium]|nr:hypothetical protein [Pirellulales bacterium]